jgi:hypothetical protein
MQALEHAKDTNINNYHNGWNMRKEKLLRFWQEECRIYSWVYARAADIGRSWRIILK